MNQALLNLLLSSLPWLLSAGIDLQQALGLLRRQQKDKRLIAGLQQLSVDIQQGQTLSRALNQLISVPPPVLLCIRTGEATGKLSECLEHARLWIQTQQQFKRAIKTQLFYPAMLLVLLILAFFLAFTLIMPSFEKLYAQFQAPLPGATRSMIAFHQVLMTQGLAYFSLLSMCGLLIYTLTRTSPRIRVLCERTLLACPYFGSMIRFNLYQRLCLLLHRLLTAGVTLSESLALLSSHMHFKGFEQSLKQSALALSQGKSLSSSLKDSPYINTEMVELLALGTESGRLDTVLLQLGQHYSQQLKQRQTHFKQIIQPVLLLCVGVLTGVWVLLLYYPLIQLGSLIG